MASIHQKLDRPDKARNLTTLPYAQVRRRIMAAFADYRLGTEGVALDRALGRTCARTMKADLNIPPAAVSAMDGYAILSANSAGASPSSPVKFRVAGSSERGERGALGRLGRGEACYVPTGAPIPEGTDCVVKVEDTSLKKSEILVMKSLSRWKNVIKQGDDVRVGQKIIQNGRRLGPASIALLLAMGKKTVEVYRTPRVGVLSVGSELRKVEDRQDGRTVNNFAHLLSGYLAELGAEPVLLGVAGGSPGEIRRALANGTDGLDMLITIGRSSVGVGDDVPEVIGSTDDSEVIFHGLRLLPVRPTGLARIGRMPVCMLPGHCVSAAYAFFLIAVPVLNLMTGTPFDSRPHTVRASISAAVANDRPIGALTLVELGMSNGDLRATPLPWGSNSLSNLARASGFVQIEPGTKLRKDREVTVTLLGGFGLL